jgi:hypothetical protein
VVEIQLRALRDRLASRHLTLAVSDAALDRIADEGYDPTYGARPLKRVLQGRLQDPPSPWVSSRDASTRATSSRWPSAAVSWCCVPVIRSAPPPRKIIDAEVVEA